MSEAAKNVLNRFFSTMDNQNWDEFRTLLHPKHCAHLPVAPEPVGVDAHVALNQEFHKSFPGYVHVIEGQTCDGDMVTTWGHVKMKHTAEFRGIPATNKEFDIGFIDVARVVDGQVREEWAQIDALKIMTEVGLFRAA